MFFFFTMGEFALHILTFTCLALLMTYSSHHEWICQSVNLFRCQSINSITPMLKCLLWFVLKVLCINEATILLNLSRGFDTLEICAKQKWKGKWRQLLCDLFPFIDYFKLHLQSKQKSKPDWMLPAKLQLLIPIYSCVPNGLPFTSCLIKLSSVKKKKLSREIC